MYFIIHYQLCENVDYGNHLLDFSKDQWLQIEELDHFTQEKTWVPYQVTLYSRRLLSVY